MLGAWVPVGMSPRGFLDVSGQPPFFLEKLGRQECGRLPGDNGPLSCWVAAGPQTIGVGQALSCCPWPETDAQEPPVSAPGLTSRAALSLRGRTPERERGKQWGPHARRPVPGTGWGLPGESMAWQVLLLCGGTGAFPGASQPGGRTGVGLEALLLSREDPTS